MTRPAGPLMHRRAFGAGLAVTLGTSLVAAPLLAAGEQAFPGMLGFYVLDTATGHGGGDHIDQRFAMCSSFKLSLAAHVLHLAQQGRLNLAERVTYSEATLTPLGHVPDTRAHLATGMTVLELAQAAVINSDNAAANLLLERSGGPAGLTAFWRMLGDRVTRLDDNEPALNRVPLGSMRNTSTPRAMAHTLAAILLGPVLTSDHRQVLLDWMHASTTGLKRIRAGIPADWWAGDKTGTGLPDDAPATYVDLAFLRPPRRAPLIVTAFLRSDQPRPAMDPAAEARIAQAMHLWMTQPHNGQR